MQEKHCTRAVMALRAAGVTAVTAQYNGSGDSMDEFTMDFSSDGSDVTIEEALKNDIETVLMDCIDREHGGFENNEGGGGRIELFLDNYGIPHLKWEHFDNIIQQEVTNHAFDGEDAQ